MSLVNTQAIFPDPNTSRQNKLHAVHPYLLRDIEITRPDQAWRVDITYSPVQNGFMYLVALLDFHSRYITSSPSVRIVVASIEKERGQGDNEMGTHSQELKESLVRKVLENPEKSLGEIARNAHISKSNLYSWVSQAKRTTQHPLLAVHSTTQTVSWRSEQRFQVLMDPSFLSGEELNQYCREKGLYKQQLLIACLNKPANSLIGKK